MWVRARGTAFTIHSRAGAAELLQLLFIFSNFRRPPENVPRLDGSRHQIMLLPGTSSLEDHFSLLAEMIERRLQALKASQTPGDRTHLLHEIRELLDQVDKTVARDIASSAEPHYHIRWVSSGAIDWERHGTQVRAEESAKKLARSDEEFEILEVHGACAQCRETARS